MNQLHDVPGLGIFTSAIAENLAGLGLGNATEAELRAAFDRMDLDHGGTLDRGEIAEAMRGMGKSEREIQKLVSAMPADALTFEQFKDMMQEL